MPIHISFSSVRPAGCGDDAPPSFTARALRAYGSTPGRDEAHTTPQACYRSPESSLPCLAAVSTHVLSPIASLIRFVANRAATAYCDHRERGRVGVDAERVDRARGSAHVQPGTLVCRRASSEAGHLIAVMQLEEGRGCASGGCVPKADLAIFTARGGEQPARHGAHARYGAYVDGTTRLESERRVGQERASRDRLVVASERVNLMRDAIRYHQWQSVVVASEPARASADPRGDKWPSRPFEANQGHSKAMKATQRTCLSVRRSHSLSSQPTELKPLEPVSTYGPEQSQQSGK